MLLPSFNSRSARRGHALNTPHRNPGQGVELSYHPLDPYFEELRERRRREMVK